MKKIILIVPLIFLLFLAINAKAQIATNPCPDKCVNSTFYTKGLFDSKLKTCVYGYQENCKYGCRINDTMIFETPSCNEFPKNDTSTALEKIYSDVNEIKRNIVGKSTVTISTGGTDYFAGETANIFAKVHEEHNPIDDAFCDAIVFYPNMTEYTGFDMDYVPSSRGLYSKNMALPDTMGVYPIDIECVRPISATSQTYYLSTYGGYGFGNVSGNGEATQVIIALAQQQSLLCFQNRFIQQLSQFNDGTFRQMRFLSNITKLFAYFYKSGVGSATYDITIYFYKKSSCSEITLGSSYIPSVSIGTTETLVNFPDVIINYPFTEDSTIEAEVCARKLLSGSPDFYIAFNSSAYNSSFMVNSKIVNASVDFEVGGSSEIHIANISSMNITVNTNASQIWSYPNRTLTDYNQSSIISLLQYMNSTESLHFTSLYNLIVSVNSSINQNIVSVNDSISSILGQLQSIQNNLTLVYNLVGASNATIMNKLFKIQDEITSVNDTIKSINQSIENHLNNIDTILNSIQSDLNQIKGNLTEIEALSQEINVTVNGIVGILGNISTDISGLNSSLIAHIDTSLSNLEFNLTNLIISVNNTIIASNTTIMNKLYGIQNEIANINQTIINGLMNISNVTVNITTSQQEVIKTMFALFGNQAKSRNYAYLGIGGGLTGFLTGGDSGAIYYCKDNMTLAQYSVQNVSGSINMTNIFEDLTHCTYGCVQNACVIPQYMIWLYVLLALLAGMFIYLWFTRETNGIVNTD